MNTTMLLAVLPLVLALVIYVAQAAGYQLILNRPGMALAFVGYVIANAGLIWDAIAMGVVK